MSMALTITNWKEVFKMQEFLKELSSSAPTPGGGGAAALIGAISCSLCSMVANLTTGKKKYAQYQEKIEEYIGILEEKNKVLQADIKKDADAFAPLAAAYSLDKNTEGYEDIMENATLNAAIAPLEITRDIYSLVPIIEDMAIMGSRLAISDVAVAATSAKAAIEGAVMNIFINTKSLRDREKAEAMNKEAMHMVNDANERLTKVYESIRDGMI